jgi:hypothetical protein
VSLFLMILYPIAIQGLRGGLWRVLLPLTVVAWVVDVVANYTELALLTWDFPRKGEHTFSTRCERLITQQGWSGFVGRQTQLFCNFFYSNHIKGTI